MSQEVILESYGVALEPLTLRNTDTTIIIGFFLFTLIAAVVPALSAFKKARNSHV